MVASVLCIFYIVSDFVYFYQLLREVSKSPVRIVTICWHGQSYRFLIYEVWCSVIKYIHIQDFFDFLINCPFYHHEVHLLRYSVLKFNLSDININSPAFLLLLYTQYIFPSLLTCNLFVSLKSPVSPVNNSYLDFDSFYLI